MRDTSNRRYKLDSEYKERREHVERVLKFDFQLEGNDYHEKELEEEEEENGVERKLAHKRRTNS